MKTIFLNCGIDLITLCWDHEFAELKRQELTEICKSNNLEIPDISNDFAAIYAMAQKLSERDIPYDEYNIRGKTQTIHWAKLKGLDDYLAAVTN